MTRSDSENLLRDYQDSCQSNGYKKYEMANVLTYLPSGSVIRPKLTQSNSVPRLGTRLFSLQPPVIKEESSFFGAAENCPESQSVRVSCIHDHLNSTERSFNNTPKAILFQTDHSIDNLSRSGA